MQIINELISKLREDPRAAQRLEQCAQCDKFDFATDQCKLCGCNMILKAFIPISSCPERKW